MHLHWQKYTLQFKRPSGTSRGTLQQKETYFLHLHHEGIEGIGECGLLRGLSQDDYPDYEQRLEEICTLVNQGTDPLPFLTELPSIRFGWEMALKDLENGGKRLLYPSEFTRGQDQQPINGLIWMGDPAFMRRELGDRLEQGFRCIKMKIGAVDFEAELNILRSIRRDFSPGEVEIRVDANGAFSPGEAHQKLERLAEFHIHSIEQPIRQGQWEEMGRLCESSPVPIALDEELIGLFSPARQEKMMATIRPQYIILKPSLVGGWQASETWIQLAEAQQAGWWVTSALESNIGLNAIAQWTYTLGNPLPQGLGTGSLYVNNIPSPLYVATGHIGYDPAVPWDLAPLTQLTYP